MILCYNMNIKRCCLIFYLPFVLLLAVPFNFVYAEDYYPFSLDNVIGVNVYVTADGEYTSGNPSTLTDVYVNTFNVVFDRDFYGSITLTVQYYLSDSTNTLRSFNKTVYINGHSVDIDMPTTGSYVLRNQNVKVTSFKDNQLFAKNNLDFPFESYTPVTYAMKNLNYSTMVGLFEWTYPSFYFTSGDSVLVRFTCNPDTTLKFIAGFSKPFNNLSTSTYKIYASYSDSTTPILLTNRQYVTSATVLNSDGSDRFYWYSFDIVSQYSGSGSSICTISVSSPSDFYYVPIYLANEKLDNISTDFALRFGLSNRLLDDLDIIADHFIGNSDTDESSDQLADQNQKLGDSIANMVSVEDQYNQSFNDSLNSIDFSSPINSQMLSGSSFFITVFNSLIADNPFSILIIVMAILFIARKLLS